MAERTAFKHGLGKEAVDQLARFLTKSMPDFRAKEFKKQALNGLEDLELKDRVRHLISVLRTHLPDDFTATAPILAGLSDYRKHGGELSGFAIWPLVDYVGEYGLEQPAVALELLRNLTPEFSGEFAIRPFLDQHSELTLGHLHRWCVDRDEHVRRLVSEGTRSRLPWGQRLPRFIADPAPVLDLLEKLKDDPSEYVRRSVANNLNDISKDNPDLVINICRSWLTGASTDRKRLIRHAVRTLIKAGHPAVFPLLGFTENPDVKIRKFKLHTDRVAIGENLEFTFEVVSQSDQSQSFVMDFAIHYMKANGKTSPKVFKLRNLTLGPHDKKAIVKKHAFKIVTTRKYYTGHHAVELMVNGVPVQKRKFDLI